MRYIFLALLAACEADTGVVHDGDADVVLVAQTVIAECDWTGRYMVDWPVPAGTTELERYDCLKDYPDDPDFYACYLRETLADVGEDGILHFQCASREGEVSWRIDYVAPRP